MEGNEREFHAIKEIETILKRLTEYGEMHLVSAMDGVLDVAKHNIQCDILGSLKSEIAVMREQLESAKLHLEQKSKAFVAVKAEHGELMRLFSEMQQNLECMKTERVELVNALALANFKTEEAETAASAAKQDAFDLIVSCVLGR